MKTILLFLCMLVVLPYEGSAQWQNHVDTTHSNVVLDSLAASTKVVAAEKNGNLIVSIDHAGINNDPVNAELIIDGTSYFSIQMPGDNPWSSSGCNLITFAENSDSVFVLGGRPELTIAQGFNARARVTSISNPDSTELAVSFYNSQNVSDLRIKGAYLNDSLLYILVDDISSLTSVEVVVNNGQPQAGTSLTGTGAAFFKIDRSTGAILQQFYFNNSPNKTLFHNKSLTKAGNKLVFTSDNQTGGDYVLHIYDMNSNLIVNNVAITTPGQPGPNNHFLDRVIGYGTYNGDEYLGLIPENIPVTVNLTTLDVMYISAGNVFGSESPSSVLFVDSSFIFFSNSWITRVELADTIPSVIRRDFVTKSSTLDGRGMSSTQRNARVGHINFISSKIVNNQIEYYGRIKLSKDAPNGIYINGEQITSDSILDHDNVIFKGTLGLSTESYAGTETQFDSDTCIDSVEVSGYRVTYPVDSAGIDNVSVDRTPGPHAILMGGVQANETIDFSNSARNIISTLDYPSPGDISTIRTYVERAKIVVPEDTTTIDTSDVSLREELEVAPIYPNPFRDYITIPELYDNRNYRMNIYDMSRRVILQEQNIAGRIQLSHLVPGVYIVHIFDDHTHVVSRQRIVKQR